MYTRISRHVPLKGNGAWVSISISFGAGGGEYDVCCDFVCDGVGVGGDGFEFGVFECNVRTNGRVMVISVDHISMRHMP